MQYEKYLSEARKYAEDGITKYAIENYNSAIVIKSNPEIYKEVADYYKKQDKKEEYLNWCEQFFEEYPTSGLAYDSVLDAYINEKDYESCYDILETATKRNISTDFIKKTAEEIKYVFSLDFNTFDDISIYSNNYCAVESKDLWGFVDRFGNQRIACRYTKAGSFTKSNFAPVVNKDGDSYFIDKDGSKVMVSKEKYKEFGLLVDNILVAHKSDDKFVYLDSDFKELFGSFDFASTFNNGIAAVKTGDSWQLVNSKGKAVCEKTFKDVKLDEKNIAFRNDRAFVSVDGNKYIMIDENGKQIGSNEFADAVVFGGESYTAVKVGEQWQFIDKNGKFLSDKKFGNARSFVNGLAAVCIDGKWGFVEESGKIAIEPQFFDAKDFNEKGSCFVKTGDRWQLLKLYRINREG